MSLAGLRPQRPAAPLAPSDSRTGRSSRALVLILALAAALRWLRLDGSSLWSDEGNSWAMLRRGFGAIAAAAAQDIHPPGYYWLLKVWCLAAGGDAWGMRSLSALCGVGLVGVVYRIGLLLDQDSGREGGRLAITAAFLAAVNPFLIHYSQEARMYSLLALESGLLFWSAMSLVGGGPKARRSLAIPLGLLFTLAAAAGLWTHYSFPIVLAAADLFVLLALRRRLQGGGAGAWPSVIGKLLVLNVPAVLLFGPWLPTAWRAVTQWPASGRRLPMAEALPLLGRTFAFGPLGPEPLALLETNLGLTGAPAVWMVRLLLSLALLLPLLGLWSLRRSAGGAALALWLGAPLGLMLGLGLFGDAFQKFLLVAVPAWCLAVAAAVGAVGRLGAMAGGARRETGAPNGGGGTGAADPVAAAGASWSASRRALQGWLAQVSLVLVVVGGLLPAAAALPSYYRPPGPRDDYAGVASELAATGDPQRDLVLLCAPGQAEVWGYYDPGLPVLALPVERPPDAARTVAALQGSTRGRRQLTALWWAEADADPEGIIAGWLAAHAFAGPTRWAGNVRVAQYGLAEALDCAAPPGGADFGDGIRLEAACFPRGELPTPGRLLLAELRWRALARPSAAYAVSAQLLRPTVRPGASDATAGVDVPVTLVAQQDGQPVGGTRPTDGWAAGDVVADRRAIALPPDAAPGDYLLRVALYDPVDGRRLRAGDRDHVDLPVRVVNAARAGTVPSRPRR